MFGGFAYKILRNNFGRVLIVIMVFASFDFNGKAMAITGENILDHIIIKSEKYYLQSKMNNLMKMIAAKGLEKFNQESGYDLKLKKISKAGYNLRSPDERKKYFVDVVTVGDLGEIRGRILGETKNEKIVCIKSMMNIPELRKKSMSSGKECAQCCFT